MTTRPGNGYWVIRHWARSQRDRDMKLAGEFRSSELRWLADRLDEHNSTDVSVITPEQSDWANKVGNVAVSWPDPWERKKS